MDDPRDIVRDFREIAPDYAPDPDALMNEEDDRVRRLKQVIADRLDPWERNVIILYADCGSLRQLGKRLGLSHSSVRRVVDDIKQKVLAAYFDLTAEELTHELRTKEK